MKKIIIISMFIFTGCAPTIQTKSVVVNKDKNGVITGYVETETVQQSLNQPLVQLQYVK